MQRAKIFLKDLLKIYFTYLEEAMEEEEDMVVEVMEAVVEVMAEVMEV